MKNLLEYILIHLVDNPEEVNIEEHQDGDTWVYTIRVHQEDVGRVIGKGGSVIQSIRNIAKIRSVKEGIHAQIVLED
ncbi:MAG: KH domain-containing protein [Microgenomates group bacterium]